MFSAIPFAHSSFKKNNGCAAVQASRRVWAVPEAADFPEGVLWWQGGRQRRRGRLTGRQSHSQVHLGPNFSHCELGWARIITPCALQSGSGLWEALCSLPKGTQWFQLSRDLEWSSDSSSNSFIQGLKSKFMYSISYTQLLAVCRSQKNKIYQICSMKTKNRNKCGEWMKSRVDVNYWCAHEHAKDPKASDARGC